MFGVRSTLGRARGDRPPAMKRSVRRRGSSGEGASICAFLVLLLASLFVLVGLVYDGGSALAARQAAEVEAEQAARAGAGALSLDALRHDEVVIDIPLALARARAFTVAAGHPGTPSVSGGTVTVHIAYRVTTTFLGIVGISSLPVRASASASDVSGVTKGS